MNKHYEHHGHPFEVESAVAISLLKSIAERVAIVTEVTPDEIWLKLRRPTLPLPFEKGQPVRIKQCSEGNIYYWNAEVLSVSGSEKQNVAISLRDEGMTLQRRKYFRLRSEIPLSYTVIQASESQLLPEKVLNLKTQNISEGGLAFETDLPLKVGDELQVNLDLPSSQHVSAAGWVVRTEQIEEKGKYVHSIGLEFLELKPEVRTQLRLFLDQAQRVESSQ